MLNAAGKKKKDRFFNLAWQKVPMDPKNKNKVRAQFDAPRSAVAVGVAGVCMWFRVCVARPSIVRGGEASNNDGCAGFSLLGLLLLQSLRCLGTGSKQVVLRIKL